MAESSTKWVDEEWSCWVAHLTICPQEKKKKSCFFKTFFVCIVLMWTYR